MTLIELGLIASLSIANSPYPKDRTALFPSLTFQQQTESGWYYKIISEARCEPSRINRWNPVTATWDVSIGRQLGAIQVYIGHQSSHSVGLDYKYEADTESLDYIGLKYRIEYK